MNVERGGSIDMIRHYWNNRAKLGEEAGTRDIIAKLIEVEAIAKYVADGMKILEVGCGNGMTATQLAKRFKVNIFGLDYAPKMVEAARNLAAKERLKGRVRFDVGDVCAMPNFRDRFDLIYTERMLINLEDWQAQKKAIECITGLLVPGGVYVMCENSQDGLDKINAVRERIGLPKIDPPWHNVYFCDANLETLLIPRVELEAIDYYSSTYYFLSRVVNAWLAKREGKESNYEAPVNQLALMLPPIGDMAQGRIWLWRRNNE